MWRLHSRRSRSLTRAADAVAEEEAVRHDHAAPAARLEDPLDELKEQQRGLRRPRCLGEVRLDRLLLLAAERRVGEDDVDAVGGADLRDRAARARCRARSPAARSPWRARFIIPSRYGSGFFSIPRRFAWSSRRCSTVSTLRRDVLVGLDEEAAGAAGGVEHDLAEAAGRPAGR